MKKLHASLVALGWGMTVAAAFAPRASADASSVAAAPAPSSSSSASGPKVAPAPPPSEIASGSASATVAAPAPSSSPTSAPPTATIGIVQVIRGGNAPSTLPTALSAVQPAIDACYAEAIAKEGDGDANVALRLEVAPPGRVVSAIVASSEDASVTLRGCVRDAFAGLSAGPISKQPLEVLLPIAFARDDASASDTMRPGSACPATWEDDGVEGELPDALRGALADRAVRAGYCFKRPAAPGESPTLKKGAMEIHLRLAPDGSVCGASAVGDDFDRASLTSCVLETMSEPFAEKPVGAIEVVVPIKFQGS